MRCPAFRTLIATAIALSATAGCSGGSATDGAQAGSASGPPSPTASSASRPAGASAPLSLTGLHAVRPCPGPPAFSCGRLRVRLDPFGPAPGRLSLQVAVSDVAAAPRGVLVVLTGGPGQPGVPFLSRLAGRLAALAPDGHLIVVPMAGHSVQSRAAGNPALAAVRQFLAAG
jgi:hypothetical protein